MNRLQPLCWAILVLATCVAFADFAQAQINYPDMMYYKMNGGNNSSPVNDAFPRVGSTSASYSQYSSSYAMYSTTGTVTTSSNSTSNCRYSYNWYYRYGYYGNTGYNFDFTEDDSCTIEFWCRNWNYYSSYSPVFGTNSISYFSAYQQSNRVYFYFGGNQIDSNVNDWRSPTSGTWTHYAMVYDAPNRQLRTYIDGNLSNSRDGISISQSSQRVYLFNYRSYTGSSSYDHFQGYVDELRIWRRVRTQEELNQYRFQELERPNGFVVSATEGGDERVKPTNNQVVWRGILGSSNTSANMSSITFTKTGSLPDSNITSVKLYTDNGNGQPGSQIATGSMSNGQAQLNWNRNFSSNTFERVVLTYDISSNAPGGATFGATVASPSDVTLSSGTTYAFSDERGPVYSLVGKASSLPWSTNFDTMPMNSFVYDVVTSNYPYAGSTTSSVNTSWWGSGDGAYNRIEAQNNNVSAASAPNMMTLGFGSPSAQQGLDFHFDLSNYNLTNDQIMFNFKWNDNDSPNYDANYEGVFLSINGGTSWLRMVYRFDMNQATQVWRDVSIDLQAALQNAGQSSYGNDILLRIQCTGSSASHRMHIDDASLIVLEPALMLEKVDTQASAFPTAPGAADVAVQGVKLTAMVDAQSITSFTVTKTGNIDDSEVSAVKLFRDANNNGAFDAADTQLGMDQTFTSGEATFTGSPLLGLMADEEATLFVTYSIDAMVSAGATFGSRIAASTDISISSSDPITAAGGFPLNGRSQMVAEPATLPFSTSFEEGIPTNVSGTAQAGVFPFAGSTTATISSGFSGVDARMQLNSGTFEGIDAFDGRNFMSIDYPDGSAAGAIDFSFDLSAYDAANDSITFSFWVRDMADGEDNGEFDGVFISDDAGATWVAKAWHPNWASINGWERIDINVSDVMTAASATFTGDMVIRIQASDDLGAPWDGIAIDSVFCGLSAVASVSRMGNDIADAGMDDLGSITLDTTTTLTYEIENLGHQDLEVNGAFAVDNVTNIDSTVGINFVPANDGESFEVTFQPMGIGAFSFDMLIPFPNDPALTNGVYVITVQGDGGIAPSITSTAPAIATVGRLFSYDLTATGSPAPTFSVQNAPAWLTLSGSTLSGTPTSGDVGPTAPITVVATNGVGMDDIQDFQITVSQEVEPTITSTPITMATVGQVYQYILSADGAPEPTFSVTGLPTWLTLNGNVITGTAAAQAGMPVPTYMTGTITVTATNGIGLDDQQTFEITVVDPAVAASAQITSVPATTAEAGVAYSYQIGVAGNPTPTVMVTGLPTWLAFDSVTNIISGTPAAADAGTTAEITIEAENGVGQNANQTFTLMVIDASVEARITSVPATFIQIGQDYNYTIVASGDPAPTLDVQGLPDWLVFDAGTNTISGRPAGADIGLSTAITVTASNGIGVDDVQSFQIVVIPAPSSDSEDSECSLNGGSNSSSIVLMLLAAMAALGLATRKRNA